MSSLSAIAGFLATGFASVGCLSSRLTGSLGTPSARLRRKAPRSRIPHADARVRPEAFVAVSGHLSRFEMFRNHWREPGDLVKVFQRTQAGEEFIGHAEFDPRERIVLWYPSGV